MRTYREQLKRNSNDLEKEDVDGKIAYIETSIVDDLLSDIESEVNDIKDKLENYTVFSEINEIHILLQTLSKNLY
jgi:hypothetical protein